eukprot:gene41860-48302_t
MPLEGLGLLPCAHVRRWKPWIEAHEPQLREVFASRLQQMVQARRSGEKAAPLLEQHPPSVCWGLLEEELEGVRRTERGKAERERDTRDRLSAAKGGAVTRIEPAPVS